MDSLNPPQLTHVTPGESTSVNWKIQVEEKNRQVQFLCLDGASCLLKLSPSARLRFFLKPAGGVPNIGLSKDVEPTPQNLSVMSLCVRLENIEPAFSRAPLSKIGITVSVENLMKTREVFMNSWTKTTQNLEVISPRTFVLKHGAENNGSNHVVLSKGFLNLNGGNKSGESYIWNFKINVSTTKVDLYNQVNGNWELMEDA